jgi:hypothetical protein
VQGFAPLVRVHAAVDQGAVVYELNAAMNAETSKTHRFDSL